ncbi:MAG: omptin family outer membrane protease [Spirochaetales bacterium]|nr:omptin family outer membrane protease [Spirochaetales bacterium]
MSKPGKFLILLALVLLGFPGALHGQEGPPSPRPYQRPTYRFSLGAREGALTGTAYETVYRDKWENRLSELTWEIKPLYYLGLSLRLDQEGRTNAPTFFSRLDINLGLPGVTGFMEDRDWLGQTADGRNNALSNYAITNNKTVGYWGLDYESGWSRPLAGGFSLSWLIGVSVMHFSWEAFDGYTQRGSKITTDSTGYDVRSPWNPSLTKNPSLGLSISYTQDWSHYYLGARAGYSRGNLDLDLGVAAGFSLCLDRDSHHRRNLEVSGSYIGFLLEPSLRVSWALNPRVNLEFTSSYRWVAKAVGSGGWLYTDTGKRGSGYYGAAYSALDLGLGLHYLF